MSSSFEQYYVPEVVVETVVSATIKRLICADCNQPMNYASADIDWDDLDENHLPKMTYLYTCQPCQVKCKSEVQYPQLQLNTSEESFAVIPAPPQYGQSIPS